MAMIAYPTTRMSRVSILVANHGDAWLEILLTLMLRLSPAEAALTAISLQMMVRRCHAIAARLMVR